MLKDFYDRGVLYWLRAPRNYEEASRDEWILAITRFLLGAFCLAAFIADGNFAPPQLPGILLLSFLAYSLFIIFALQLRKRLNPFAYVFIHYINILWAAGLTLLIGSPEISFALFFFMLTAAANRWGFWEIHLTNLLFWAHLLAGCLVYNLHYHRMLNSLQIRENLPEILLSFALASIIGVLAEVKAVRSESYATANIAKNLRTGSGLEKALLSASSAGFNLYASTQILVVVNDRSRRRSVLFRMTNSQPAAAVVPLTAAELPQYFFPCPGRSWRVASANHISPPQFRCDVLEGGKMTKKSEGCKIPDSFLAACPFRLLIATSLSFSNDVVVRVYMIDPAWFFSGRAGIRFLERAAAQMAPLLYDLFTLSRLKKKAEAAAGSRIAHEIHDGIIQSLCYINMQLEELRAGSGDAFAHRSDPLARIQQTVNMEIAGLRKLAANLSSLEIDSSRLLGYLAGLTVKFQLEHGIAARFVPEVDEMHLEPHICVELAHIVQEALVNVRKHSKASEVLVRFGKRSGDWILHVADNGCGFGFAGRLAGEELQTSGKGPAVIMERAHGINAKVSIECFEQGGSCIEIAIPNQDIF
jgi:signal transduction histidine kinase